MKERNITYIEGDNISTKELERRLNQIRLNHIRFELEKIRIDDKMDEAQKAAQSSIWRWQLMQLKREM